MSKLTTFPEDDSENIPPFINHLDEDEFIICDHSFRNGVCIWCRVNEELTDDWEEE